MKFCPPKFLSPPSPRNQEKVVIGEKFQEYYVKERWKSEGKKMNLPPPPFFILFLLGP